ncbi:MAG: MFS transporter, partial [Actinobacteria bacterium]|nr:MFS transporter [Actinomycetota bacterium]
LRGPPRDAIIADDTTPANRGRAFGFHRAADTAGAVVGPLLGLGMYQLVRERFGPLLWIAVIPAVLSASLVFLVRERPHVAPVERVRWSPRALGPRYWRVLVPIALFSAVNFPDTLLLLRAKDLGFGYGGVVALYVTYNLSYALLAYPAGVVSDRRSRREVYAGGLAVFAVAYVGFGLTASAGWLWLLFPVYGGYTALTDGVSRAWIADLAPASARGTALGIHAAVSGVGLLVAGLWAGLAWQGTGRVPFLVSGALVAVLAVVLLGWRALDAEDLAGA